MSLKIAVYFNMQIPTNSLLEEDLKKFLSFHEYLNIPMLSSMWMGVFYVVTWKDVWTELFTNKQCW